MSTKRGGLGRNLSVLLSSSGLNTSKNEPNAGLLRLPLEALQPGKYQPRKLMDDDSLQELASSIKQQGLLQPLAVRLVEPNRYEIIAGERRWRACQLAGLRDVAVICHQVDDETAMAMALVENLQREDLNPMDQARAMARLIDEFELTHQQIAELLSKSRTAVSNYLRLLTLSAPVIDLLEAGDIDMGHARALLILDSPLQIQAAELVVAKNLSVRETEGLVKRLKEGKSKNQPQPLKISPTSNSLIEMIAEQLQSKIDIKQTKHGKGSIIIHYKTPNALEVMLQKISGTTPIIN